MIFVLTKSIATLWDSLWQGICVMQEQLKGKEGSQLPFVANEQGIQSFKITASSKKCLEEAISFKLSLEIYRAW